MSEENARRESAQMLLITRVVAGALIVGVMMFAGIAIVLSIEKQADSLLLTTIATVFAAVMLIARFVVPDLIAGKARPRGVPEQMSDDQLVARLAPVYQAKTIVACALLEGACFFSLTAYILEPHWLNLSVVAALVAVMGSTFPSAAKYERWVDGQIQLMQMEP